MTLVMAWREQALERVWVVSDSRLSHGREGAVRLTDSAAKILSVPAILRRQTPLDMLGTPILGTNLAFAYAGSSLIALQAYAAVLPLWSHLQTSGPEKLPSVHDFADHLGKFVLAYAKHLSSALNQFQPCQCALIGYDSELKTVAGWAVRAQLSDDITIQLSGMNLAPGEIEVFGSGAERARKVLGDLPSRPRGLWRREPLQMIRDYLRHDSVSDVGGGVQIGYVNEQGFQLSYDVQPVQPGSPFPTMRFRGFDFSNVSAVGNAFVNLPGMY